MEAWFMFVAVSIHFIFLYSLSDLYHKSFVAMRNGRSGKIIEKSILYLRDKVTTWGKKKIQFYLSILNVYNDIILHSNKKNQNSVFKFNVETVHIILCFLNKVLSCILSICYMYDKSFINLHFSICKTILSTICLF